MPMQRYLNFVLCCTYMFSLLMTDTQTQGLACPQSCPNCYSDKRSSDCYSYDKYGNYLGCRIFSGNADMLKALTEATDAGSKGIIFTIE
jgi:hypothetical protein